jgi:outer membrane receptor protein involved in Fe transport
MQRFTTGYGLAVLVAVCCLGTTAAHSAVNESRQIEEVVVTGQKIARSLQDTVASVSVVTSFDIERENLISVADVLNRTANASANAGGTGFSLRGVSDSNVTGAGLGELATVYLDGAPLAPDSINVGPLDIWDLEQIEILRGPQSTIQGRNALAGSIVMRTVDPSFQWEAKGRVIHNDDGDGSRVAMAFGGPIIDNQVAFRVAAETSESDGFVFNTTQNDFASKNAADMFRLKLLIEPDAIPELKVRLSHMVDERQFGLRDSFFDAPSSFSNRLIGNNRPTFDRSDTDFTVAEIDYEISDAIIATYIGTYSDVDRSYARDLDFGPTDESYNSFLANTETTTHELRFTFESESISALVGVYSSDLDNAESASSSTLFFDVVQDFRLVEVLQGQGLDATTAGFVASFYSEPFIIEANRRQPLRMQTEAIFADLTWELSNNWTLLAGFRFDQESQEIEVSQVVKVISPFPNPADFPAQLAPVIGLVNGFLQLQADQASDPEQNLDTDVNAFLPKIGAIYHINDWQNVGFVVQRGYRSGGVGVNTARATTHQFDAEFTTNYELAYRSTWLDNTLTVNANAFYTDWEDQQVTVFFSGNGFDFETQNAGASHLFGFELESRYVFSTHLDAYLSIGYTQTEFDDLDVLIDGTVLDLSGNEFPSAPAWTIAVGSTWQNDFGWFANVAVNHTSESFNIATQDQSAGPALPARTLVNAKVGWKNQHLGIYLAGRNIFDDEFFNTTFTDTLGQNLGRFGEPRIFGLTVEASI